MAELECSIIVAAKNEEKSIPKMLDSVLIAQRLLTEKTHLIILANQCTDQTVNVASDVLHRHKQTNLEWRVIEVNDQPGKTHALNRGLDVVKDGIVLQIDADVRVAPASLQIMLDKLKNNNYLQVVGSLDIPDFHGRDKSTLLYQYQMAAQIFREERGRVLPVGRLMAYRRDAFGKYPEGLHSEDTWIALEIARKYGWKAVEVITESQVFFSPTTNWVDFLKQESRFEQGFSQLVERFPELEEVYDRRREGKIIPSREEVGNQVRRRLEEAGISQTRFKELLDIINPIIEENSQMLENKLIDPKTGTWEQVKSTKEF